MRHFSSAPRTLIAILALAAITAGCSQMRSSPSGDMGAPSGMGSGGATSGSSGSGSTDMGPGAVGTSTGIGTTSEPRVRNNSGQTSGSTPNSSVPTSDGSR